MEKTSARVNILTKRFVSYLHTKNCNVNIVKQMISHGADVNYRDNSLNTPIHIVLQHCVDQFNLVRELLIAGAELNACNMHDKSSLHYAVMYSNDVEVLQELIAHGAAVHFKDNDHNTPLHLAVQCNKKTFVEALIRYGADVNSKNSKLETPLMIAVANGNLDIVKVLLSSRASVSFGDYLIPRPLHVALDCCVPNQHILIELMKYAAHMCSSSLNYHFLLMLAAGRFYPLDKYRFLSVKTLLKCGVLHCDSLMRTWLQCFRLEHDYLFPHLDAFGEECILQRMKMKSEFIHKNFCLLDFVREGFECNPMFQKKTPYRELIFNHILYVSRNYPAYTDIIAYRLGKVDLCLKSMELCVYALKACSEGKRRIFLTPDAVFRIAGFLPNEDVLNLITAFSDPQHFATHDFGFQNLALGKSTKRKMNENH